MSGLVAELPTWLTDWLPGLPRLASPWWALALVPLAWWGWRYRRGVPAALTYSRLPATGGRLGWRSALPVHVPVHLPFYLRLAALALLVLALCRPQWGHSWQETRTDGIDIQIALDVSVSMAAEDFLPDNRLEVAKRVAREFVRGRGSDRIGVSTFAGGAVTRSPLTSDHRMLDRLLAAIELHDEPDGTAVGVALATAAARLRDSPAATRVVVLVTDGVSNTGEIDPLSAAALCRGLGIRVYTVAVGRAGQTSIPIQLGDQRRTLIDAEVDEELLQEIATRTGGRFFRATDSDSLRQVFGEIDRLETSPLEVRRTVRYREAFAPLAWLALLLLAAPLALTALGVTATP
jgi:Ca-activated chloride channel family protein